MSVSIEVPLHVTGFFRAHLHENPLYAGSIGAGFSFQTYLKTTVKINELGEIRIFINGEEKTEEAKTSYTAAEQFFERCEIFEGVDIFHEVPAPIGCGLATSGAGALGVVFGLNELFGMGINKVELAQIAHVAEVENKTGLGSVIAQYEGQFEIRLKPGAPGIGVVKRIPVDAEVAIIVFGEIPTPEILKSEEKIKKIENAFDNKNEILASAFSIEKFCELSLDFAKRSGLLTRRGERILEIAKKYDLIGSQLMIGDGVFLFGDDLRTKIKRILGEIEEKPIKVIVSGIDNIGVRISETKM